MIPGSANALLLSSAADTGYAIERSVRFNSSDSAYLGATFGTPTDQDVFTLSMWVKRSALGSTQHLFGVSTNHSFGFTSGDALNLTFGGSSALTTTALFRDPSAWYHIVWTQNGTSHTIYVNNVSVGTATATSSVFNTAVAHQIGAGNTTNFFNGYLADVHFIDGQALDPTSFGKFDTNGVWQPKAYSGSYGTNGFHLPFSDNSTAAALGTDTSGNSNTWTVNNISVAAGADNDSLRDSPTNGDTANDTGAGGEVPGNYATLSPIDAWSTMSLSQGNLQVNNYGGYGGTVSPTIEIPKSGKWYVELNFSNQSDTQPYIGVQTAPQQYYAGYSNGFGISLGYPPDGATYFRPPFVKTSGYTYSIMTSNTDIYGMAVDMDDAGGKFYLYKNGVVQGGGDPICSNLKDWTGPLFFSVNQAAGIFTLNFGQRPFAYTAPSGFKALCTTNLPAPTIEDPSTVMDVALYTGTGSTQVISGLNMSPDFAWIKSRSNATAPIVLDIVRGGDRALFTSATNLEAGTTGISSFNSDGFTLAADTTGYTNTNTYTYVAWTWDAGSSTVTNNDGSITSQVRANPSAGFSIVSYTGDGAASATIGHGLNVAPQMIMVKNRDVADEGAVYHVGVDATSPQNYFLKLFSTSNGTAARSDVGAMWNDTAPTSSVFSVGTEDNVNASTEDYIAYCFAPVEGYSAFGSYTGNGLADGPFVYTGFRPRYILIKRSSGTESWAIRDTSRSTYNSSISDLSADSPGAEYSSASFNNFDILSNGFKPRNTRDLYNASGSTYIYAAFAESPMALNVRAR